MGWVLVEMGVVLSPPWEGDARTAELDWSAGLNRLAVSFCRLPCCFGGVVPVDIYGEFDSGSGRTLAACLTHASRTVMASLLV